MVRVLTGDIFRSGAQTLVNTVNCVGVMGKGIALEFKRRFPEMYRDYVVRCGARQVRLGEPYLFRGPSPPWVLNFPTKDHWRSVSNLADIVAGLEYLERHYEAWGITSLAVPPLGCGQGQLEWRVVGPTMYRHLIGLAIPVEFYAPPGTPRPQMEEDFLLGASEPRESQSPSVEGSRIDPAWIALVEILARIDREPYHWPVGRTTFQKLAYFATEAGLPTGLRHSRGSYGPFAADLKQITSRLVNNGLVQEQRLGRMLAVKPGPTYRDAAQAFACQLTEWEAPIARTADLILRMRTEQAEMAATVHFAAQDMQRRTKHRPTECEVLDAALKWKQNRRPPWKEEDVMWAIRNLSVLGWLQLQPGEQRVPDEEFLIHV